MHTLRRDDSWDAIADRMVNLLPLMVDDISINHVFTSISHSKAGHFSVIGSPPSAEPFYLNTVKFYNNPIFFTEFIRQGIEVIAHHFLDIEASSKFILRDFIVDIFEQVLCESNYLPTEFTVGVPKQGLRTRPNGQAYAIDSHFYCSFGNHKIASYLGTIAVLSAEPYKEILSYKSSTIENFSYQNIIPLEPEYICKLKPETVLIGRLRTDSEATTVNVFPMLSSPFIDRPLDHFPGLLLTEAPVQLAIYYLYSRRSLEFHKFIACRIQSSFKVFVELSSLPLFTIIQVRNTNLIYILILNAPKTALVAAY
jgi:hypothetical protein